MTNYEKFLIVVFTPIIILFAAYIIDGITLHTIGTMTGEVIDMRYSPPIHAPGPPLYKPAEWNIIISDETICSPIKVKSEIYHEYQIGDIIEVQIRRGLVGIIKECRIEK